MRVRWRLDGKRVSIIAGDKPVMAVAPSIKGVPPSNEHPTEHNPVNSPPPGVASRQLHDFLRTIMASAIASALTDDTEFTLTEKGE